MSALDYQARKRLIWAAMCAILVISLTSLIIYDKYSQIKTVPGPALCALTDIVNVREKLHIISRSKRVDIAIIVNDNNIWMDIFNVNMIPEEVPALNKEANDKWAQYISFLQDNRELCRIYMGGVVNYAYIKCGHNEYYTYRVADSAGKSVLLYDNILYYVELGEYRSRNNRVHP